MHNKNIAIMMKPPNAIGHWCQWWWPIARAEKRKAYLPTRTCPAILAKASNSWDQRVPGVRLADHTCSVDCETITFRNHLENEILKTFEKKEKDTTRHLLERFLLSKTTWDNKFFTRELGRLVRPPRTQYLGICGLMSLNFKPQPSVYLQKHLHIHCKPRKKYLI